MRVAEFNALNTKRLTDVIKYYRCVTESPLSRQVPETALGACGSFGQRCCSTDEAATQCGDQLTCDLGAPPSNPIAQCPSSAAYRRRNPLELAPFCRAGSTMCVECGKDGLACCPAPTVDMPNPVCDEGFGCTNDVNDLSTRVCAACGGPQQPCCWTRFDGFFCNSGASCTGEIGGAHPCLDPARRALPP